VSADAAALASFRAEADAVEGLAAGLSSGERQALLDEMARHRAGSDLLEVGTKAPGPGAITRPKAGTAAYRGLQADEAAAIEREGAERLRQVALDRSTPAAIAKSTAIDRISSVIGTAEDGGWQGACTYLAENATGIAEAERSYAQAVTRAAQQPSAAADAALEAAARSRAGYHSKLKGLLGEAYAARCAEWVDLREAFFELAARRAEELNRAARRAGSPTRWEVVTARDTLRIDGREAWDEAVLIVEKLRPGMGRPRAELVVAAQYKVENRVSALAQIERDVAREAGTVPGQAVVSFEVEGGAQRNFTLLPTGGANRPTRVLFNAEGGTVPAKQAAAFAGGAVQAQRGVLKASVSEFGAVADELMAATAARVGK
jgi:hypothetical protein